MAFNSSERRTLNDFINSQRNRGRSMPRPYRRMPNARPVYGPPVPYRNIPSSRPVYGPHAPIVHPRPGTRPYRDIYNTRPVHGPPAPARKLRPGVKPYRDIRPGGMRPAVHEVAEETKGLRQMWKGLGKGTRAAIIGGGLVLGAAYLNGRATNRSSGSMGLQPRSSGGASLYG